MFRARVCLIAAVVVWFASLAAGGLCVLSYESTPDRLGVAPAVWPSRSSILPVAGHFTLVAFVHPRCPCVRASLEELSRLMARPEGKVNVHVVLVKPPNAPEDWEPAELRSAAAGIVGAKVLTDEGGREAYRFGAETSGLVLLYDPRGRLSFRGGITAARGHHSDNPGLRTLLDRLGGIYDGCAESPVFGCPLFEDGSPCDEKGPGCTP